jgi:S-adenosylmethionine hydrolase
MAPAALGEPFEPAELVALEQPGATVEPGERLSVTVGSVDRFGNAALLADHERAAEAGLVLGAPVAVEAGGESHEAVFALTFAEAPEAGLIVYLDSYGSLALAVNRGSAAERLGLRAGDEVALRPA